MSPAFRVALSIAVIRAPCSDAELSSSAWKICVAIFRGSKSSRISSSSGSKIKTARGPSVLSAVSSSPSSAFCATKWDKLLWCYNLRDRRLEFVVNHRADIKFACFKHSVILSATSAASSNSTPRRPISVKLATILSSNSRLQQITTFATHVMIMNSVPFAAHARKRLRVSRTIEPLKPPHKPRSDEQTKIQ